MLAVVNPHVVNGYNIGILETGGRDGFCLKALRKVRAGLRAKEPLF
jgi:hypothetical protein